MDKICLTCKENFSRKKRQSFKTFNVAIFCSKSCSSKNRWENDNGKHSLFMLGNKYGIGYKHTEETKKNISEISKISPKRIGHTISEEHKMKIKLANTGENNYRWIKDRTKVKIGDRNLNDPLQKEWSISVKKRDNWTCRIADVNCGGRLESHHILRWSEYPELRY